MLSVQSAGSWDADRTARARIRDAAIARFAERGVDATSMKSVATDAGVSQALVFHHFGSKQSLRVACDEYVVERVHEQKRKAMRAGPQLDVLAALRESTEGPPVLRYLARMLAEGSPQAVALVQGMVDAGAAAFDEGVRSGFFQPMDRPRDVNAVVVLWSLGLLVLHEHAERLLGFDPTGAPEHNVRYARAAMQALRGLFTEQAYEHALRGLADLDSGEEGNDDSDG